MYFSCTMKRRVKRIHLNKAMFLHLLKTISRRKVLDANALNTELHRCLNLFDLTMIGLGCMLGAGIFVVTGTLVRDVVGPGILISYVMAGFAAFLSAMCYAEFGARIPKAGSAYTYTYMVLGEMAGFLVGWNMLLELFIGSASVAKACSGSVDSLLSGAVSNATMKYVFEFNMPWLSKYPDFLALFFMLLWSTIVAMGVKCSSILTSIFTLLNGVILIFIISFGVYFADFSNWSNEDKGGFFPYGFSGAVSASASCFFSYSGFEAIATAAEESKNPSKNVPTSLTIVIIISTLLYLGASGALTLLVPYDQVSTLAPFPAALQFHNLAWARKLVATGTTIGLSASLMSSLYITPRTIYAMALDGLLFKPLAKVHKRTQTPINAVIVMACVGSVLTFFLSMQLLVELLSIGTLMCFVVVSVDLIILRYRPEDDEKDYFGMEEVDVRDEVDDKTGENHENGFMITRESEIRLQTKQKKKKSSVGAVKKSFAWVPGLSCIPRGWAAPVCTFNMVTSSCGAMLICINLKNSVEAAAVWVLVMLCLFSLWFLLSFLVLFFHQHNTTSKTFKASNIELFLNFIFPQSTTS